MSSGVSRKAFVETLDALGLSFPNDKRFSSQEAKDSRIAHARRAKNLDYWLGDRSSTAQP
jgi:hypothetical protein